MSEPAAPAQPGLKFLEASVYIMGGLLVLMLIGLIGGIAWKATRRAEPAPEMVKELSLDAAAGEISQVSLNGDRLAVTSPGAITVFDVRRGTVIARIKLKQ